MAFRISLIALPLGCLAAAGCGTVANVARLEAVEKPAFGGVAIDLACVRQPAAGERGHPNPDLERFTRAAVRVLCVADLPFSLVGDLLTWPYTVLFNRVNAPVPAAAVTLDGPPASQLAPLVPVPASAPPAPTAIPAVPQFTPPTHAPQAPAK